MSDVGCLTVKAAGGAPTEMLPQREQTALSRPGDGPRPPPEKGPPPPPAVTDKSPKGNRPRDRALPLGLCRPPPSPGGSVRLCSACCPHRGHTRTPTLGR